MKTINVSYDRTSVEIIEPFIDILIMDRYNQISFLSLRKLTIRAVSLLIIAPLTFESLVNVEELELSLPKLVTLPANLFRVACNLSQLRLYLQMVSWIELDTFQNNYNLKKLHIYSLTFIYRAELFEKLFYLDELVLINVHNIPITIIDPEKFYLSLNYLQKLCLQTFHTTKITKLVFLKKLYLLDSNVSDVNFGKLRKLSHLSIRNKVATHPQSQLLKLPDLKVLILFNYQLISLKFDLIKYWENLRFLQIQQCDLKDLTTVHFGRQCPSLTYLSLGYNFLIENKMNLNIFTGSSQLHKLDLSYNYLLSLRHPDMFDSLTNLKMLYLNDNQISTLPINCFKSLVNLEFLDLSNNFLTTLKFGWFSLLNDTTFNLLTLDLKCNLLKRVHSIDLKPFPKLKYLNLERNSIDRLFSNNFQFVPFLKRLNLSFNRLTVLKKEHFLDLNDLRFLILFGNSIEIVSNETFSHLNDIKCLTVTLAWNSKTSIKDLILKSNRRLGDNYSIRKQTSPLH